MTPAEMGRRICDGGAARELAAYLAAGGQVHAIEPGSGMPLLHLACEHRDLDMIRALVRHGADPNLRDQFGQTPLHIAVDIDIDAVVQAGGDADGIRFGTTQLLLDLGADPGLEDRAGRTPRTFAAGHGSAALDRFDRLVARRNGPDPP